MPNMLAPGKINGLQLRNRIIRSGCFEGMCPDGAPSEALLEHHRRVAQGGAAMTTVSYCAVSPDGRAYGTEMWMRPQILPALRRITDAIHSENAAASIQLGHCGYFSSPSVIGQRPLAPSRQFNLFRLAWPRPMEKSDIQRIIDDFRQSAALAWEAGFDAVEVHGGHGYLISQYLSPYTNHRQDEYGKTPQNRARFGQQIIEAIRQVIPSTMPLLVKINIDDGVFGGMSDQDAICCAKIFADAGADALIPSCGFTSRSPFYMMRGTVPVREMLANPRPIHERLGLRLFANLFVKTYAFQPTFLLEQAKALTQHVDIPLILVGGVCDTEDMERAQNAGFSFVQMGRALIADPDLPNRLLRNETTDLACDHCNRCVAAMDAGGIACVTRQEKGMG